MKILIHHHALAHCSKNSIYVSSFIGKWVIELSKQVKSIGLLLHTTKTKKRFQDVKIQKKNVFIHDLGPSRGLKNRFQRILKINIICW